MRGKGTSVVYDASVVAKDMDIYGVTGFGLSYTCAYPSQSIITISSYSIMHVPKDRRIALARVAIKVRERRRAILE